MSSAIKFNHRSLVFLLAIALPVAPAEAKCSAPLAVEVLGSGGPDANDARASSGYVIWIDGKARLLVDAGGGVFLRFGDALLKSGFFSQRKDELPVIGPSGNDAFPGISE